MNLWLRIFLPYAAGYFLSYLLRNANAVIAPELTRELGVSSASLGLLTSAYLLAFGAFQLPLGILLDRYGPRRVEGALLVVAAAGSALFALGNTLPELALARAAIGLGVSACLMASFKVLSIWFPAERQPSMNAAVMVAGGLGALSATTPLAALLPALGWRGVFFALAALTLAAAVGIFLTPEKASARVGRDLRAADRGAGGHRPEPGLLALRAADDDVRRGIHGAAGAVGGVLADATWTATRARRRPSTCCSPRSR